jgi:hypothetical protein
MRLPVALIERAIDNIERTLSNGQLRYFRIAPIFSSEARRCWLPGFFSSMMTKLYAWL